MARREFSCRSELWLGVVNTSKRKYNRCLVRFSNENSLLDFPAFVRIMGVNQGIPCAFFLGAGASVSSGVYSAYTCLWEWKREIVRTEEPQLARQLEELSLPSVRQRIQHWLDTQGVYPEEDAPDEYGFYANVNPDVPHPRWSQASERRIGELRRRKTLPFNGYADQVAHLYAGMDLRKNY